MRCFLTLISLLVLMPFSIKAQTLTNAERRLINSRILAVIEDYERFSSLYDDDAQYYFETLFANDSTTTVFCDMLGMPSYMKDISVSEYVELMRTQSLNTTVTIKDVVKGELQFENGLWNVPVHFRKSISYIDQGGYLFSVEEYYRTDFNIVMNLSYNPDIDRCFVRSIKGSIVSDKEFPSGRFAIIEEQADLNSRTARYMSSLQFDNKPLQYNQFGQAIVSRGEAKVSDPDVEVSVDTKYEGYNYDVLTFRFTPRNGRARLRYGIAPLAYSIKSTNTSVKGKSFAQELGADWGYSFPINESFKVSVNLGAGLSFSSVRLSYKPEGTRTYKYLYSQKNSVTGLYDSKEIDYTIREASESVKYVDAFLPLYAEAEHLMGKSVLFTWNVGLKTYFSLKAKIADDYNIIATYKNNKDESAVKLHTVDAGTKPYFICTESYAKNPFDLSAFANIGLDIDVYKKRLYAMARLGYEFGLMQSYKSNGTGYRDTNQVIYDPINDRHVAFNSLISGLNFRRSSLWISFGVKFKM